MVVLVVVLVVVGGDGDAVGAGAGVAQGEPPGRFRGGGGAVLSGLRGDLGGEGVDAGGAEPAVGPAVHVLGGGAGEGVEEVGEGGVAEPVPGEVVVDAGEEVLLPEPGDELAECGGTLGVGDAVEVQQCGGGVRDVLGGRGDGVGGGPLVGVVAPGLVARGVVGPGVAVAGGLGEGLETHVLGEGLVEPDVVPPLEGDEVPEPHVGHLVGDDHGAGLPLGVGDGGAVDVLVAEGDQAGVLHGPVVELGDERLIVGVEGVRLLEDLVVAVEAAAGDVEDLHGVPVEVGPEGAADVQAEGEPGVFGADGVPGAGGYGEEVGAEGRGGGGSPSDGRGGGRGGGRRAGVRGGVFGGCRGGFPGGCRGGVLGGCRRGVLGCGDGVGEDGPAGGRGDGDVEQGFEVGLVEGGEDATAVVEEALGVDVGLAVGGVGETVHALAGAGVAHVGLDAEFVLARGEAGERQPVVPEERRVEVVPVEEDAAQPGGFDVGEGVSRGGGGEADDGGGAEHVVAAGEIEVDGVAVDAEEAGSGSRFVACQCGHGAMLPKGAVVRAGPGRGTGGAGSGRGTGGAGSRYGRVRVGPGPPEGGPPPSIYGRLHPCRDR